MKSIVWFISIIIYMPFTNCSIDPNTKAIHKANKEVLSQTPITQVPEECLDSKIVIINKLVKLKQLNGSLSYFVIYANYTHYVKIDGITEDHLPIVQLENQPKKYDHRAKVMLRHAKKVDDYLFEDNSYSTITYDSHKNKTIAHFIGFNSVWLGCPQSLCLSSNLDAATRLSNGTVYVFRGNYYWNLENKPPMVEKAMRISLWKGNTIINNGFESGYFTSVVTDLRKYTSFFKSDVQYIWDNNSILEEPIRLTPSEFQHKMDAGFYIMNGSKGLTYGIRGKIALTDANPFHAINVTSMGIFWDKVNAAYGENKTIYIFKDWYYIKLEPNSVVPVKPKFIFEDIFNCDKTFYDNFGGYETYVNKYLSLKDGKNVERHPKRDSADLKSTHSNDGNNKSGGHEMIVIIIIIVSLFIAILIFIVLRNRNQQRYRVQTSISMN